MTKNLVHKIKEFEIGTKLEEIEEFMNSNGVIDSILLVGQRDIVEKHRSHCVDQGYQGSSEHDYRSPEFAYNHVTVRHTTYIVHYKVRE